MNDLREKVVWITGASSGIGEALTYEFAKLNSKIIISARRKEELERVKSSCSGDQNNIKILTLDVADITQISERTEEAWELFGSIDVLINNAGVSQRGLVKETILDVDRRLFEINYFGNIALTKYLLPKMMSRNSGYIVVTSSVAGKVSTPLRSAYAATKHALQGFYDALRAEMVQDKKDIRVLLVCPGFIKTNITYHSLKGSGEPLNEMGDAHKKGISPEDCAKRIIRGIKNNKEEIYIAGFLENFAVYVKRFFPSLYSKLVTRIKST
ncbi:MAG: SDR family oxidoreductase [Bacteroidota bacterium]